MDTALGLLIIAGGIPFLWLVGAGIYVYLENRGTEPTSTKLKENHEQTKQHK